MASAIDIQRIADGPKGTIIKVVYISDGTVDTGTLIVDSANLSGALDSTGNIRVGQTLTKPYYRTDLRKLYGHSSLKTGAYAKLKDNANNIVTIGTGPVELDFDAHGLGTIHANGNILMDTSGVGVGDTFTLMICLKKNPADFTQGQHADPAAFNKKGIV